MRGVERAMGMSDDVWKRHASPWSVWTRVPILPLLALAVWSRVWLGWWALVPLIVLAVWTWLNPRIFSPPATTKNWASRATFGERVWMNRKNIPISPHHVTAVRVLLVPTTLGLPVLIWGLYALDIWPTLLGLVLTLGGKLWFLDRMVWIYMDMRSTDDTYASWEY